MVIAVSKQKWDVFYLLLCFQLVLFVFWCFNLPKAFLFMGDVGSLALGGMYAMTSLYLDCLGPFIIMSGLFIFETLSVILQVFYFKRTKGKRLFKMAPFHHHLELCHFPEIGIDLLFYLIQFFLIFLGWMAYF